jgi:hypothetical protein
MDTKYFFYHIFERTRTTDQVPRRYEMRVFIIMCRNEKQNTNKIIWITLQQLFNKRKIPVPLSVRPSTCLLIFMSDDPAVRLSL